MIAELAEIPFFEPLIEAAGKFIKKKYKTTEFLHNIRELEEEYKRNVFEHLSWQEEFDWTGLIEYIDENLLGSIAAAFLSPHREFREAVRKQAYIRAYCSAKADTVTSQRQVDRLMDKILIQTGDFLCGQQNPSDWLPFNQATDQICVRLDTWEHNVKEMIEDQTQTFARQYEKILASLEYQNSFARVVDQIRLPQPVDSLFNYRDPKIGFYGREKETAYLDGFLDREEPVLFTAVNGPAGAGKSKFLYEYVKGLSANPNWKCLFLQNRKILEKFTGLCEWNYPVNLLVVIDYAGDYAGLIGEWLVSLRTGECPLKMRIVLLEREGVGKNRGVDGIQEKIVINPMWYEQLLSVHSNDDIRSMLYTADKDSAFLELPVLSDKALKQIIIDFAKAEQKVLSEEDQKQILEYCKKIEKDDQGACRPRPLILLFIVDAWDPQDKHHRWDIQELLLKIIHRYKKHWETVLCQGNKNVYMAVERLLIYATATGGWKIKDPLPEYLQKDLTVVKEFCMTRDKLDQLFRSVNEKFEWDGILSPLEPDLIGELFVLEYLQNDFEAEKMVEAFHTSKKYLLFLFRSIQDYADVDKYADLFSDGLKTLLKESLIRKIPELYAGLLVNLSAVQKEEYARETLEHLEKFALDGQYEGNEKIVLMYAKGLVNLAFIQGIEEAETTVEKLEELAGDNQYAGNEEIVLEYAKGLFNLAAKQEAGEAENTVKKLEELSRDSQYAGNEAFALMYARGLVNLLVTQNVMESVVTEKRLRELAGDNRYAENEEIVLEYGKGLVNLAAAQEAEEAELTVRKLGKLLSGAQCKGNEQLVLIYVKGLFNLVVKQRVEEAKVTVEKLEELLIKKRYAVNEEVVLTYARSLFNLVTDQRVEEAEITVEKLEELAGDNRYAENINIVLEYARSLVNLIVKQEEEKAEIIVEKLEKLARDSRYAGNEEIVLTYAKGLFNLAIKQEAKEAEITVGKLEKLAGDSRYAGNEEIVLTYAKGLFNLAIKQEAKEAEITVGKLEKLAGDSRYAGNEEIVLEYAKGLVNLTADQGVKKAEITVNALAKLASDDQYEESKKIVLEYAKGLYNLAVKQEEKEAETTMKNLEGLYRNRRYAGNEEIVLWYAKSLFNLAMDQEVKEAESTVKKLGELAGDSRYAGNEEIVLVYAKGLVNLALKQEAREAETTVEKLEDLAGDSRYAGNKEIVYEYAEGLVNLGFLYYSQHDYEQAEKRFAQAHQLHCPSGSTNLCYMIRRRETYTHSLDEFKEIMLSVWEGKDAFAVMNMALYLAEYEDDWKGADDLISSLAETEDFSGVIDWWSHLEELEGLLVMTWLERNKICNPCYILEGENKLKSLREKYPGIPDWMIEPAVELEKGKTK